MNSKMVFAKEKVSYEMSVDGAIVGRFTFDVGDRIESMISFTRKDGSLTTALLMPGTRKVEK